MANDRANEKTIDVFGIGNALVDVLAMIDDDFIREHDLGKGGMILVDAEKQAGLLRYLSDTALSLRSGGSAANTMIAVAQSGGSGFYSGKVSRDAHGEFYRQDMLDAGIHFDVHPADTSAGPTGTSLILTTPDAERTMCTNLGVSTTLSPTDVNVDRLVKCKYAYVEGYLWDAIAPRQACIETMEQSRQHDVQVSFTFSDPFLVDRFADDFRTIVRDYCDVVFCNAEEARQFFATESLDECAAELKSLTKLAFVTNGAAGCLVVTPAGAEHVDGFSVRALDTVGAGDAFAGGVLYGLTNGLSPARAARWGNYFASRIVEVHGARLETSLADRRAEVL
jgi:sugar/nucleoside kinase (ribokinase family)